MGHATKRRWVGSKWAGTERRIRMSSQISGEEGALPDLQTLVERLGKTDS